MNLIKILTATVFVAPTLAVLISIAYQIITNEPSIVAMKGYGGIKLYLTSIMGRWRVIKGNDSPFKK